MSSVIVVLLIAAAIVAFVACMVWKVLKAPIAPPAPQTPMQTEPMIETAPRETVVPWSAEPLPEPVRAISPMSPPAAATPHGQASAPKRIRPPNSMTVDQITDSGYDGVDIGKAAAVTGGIVALAALTGFLVIPVGAMMRAARGGRTVRRGRRPLGSVHLSGSDDDLGWKPGSSLTKEKDVPTLNVSVFASGRIEVEGREVTIPQLEASLADLKSRGGKVRYYREPVEPKPPQASEVLGLIVNLGIPFVTTGQAAPSIGPRASK